MNFNVLVDLYDIKDTPVLIRMLSSLQPWGILEIQVQKLVWCGYINKSICWPFSLHQLVQYIVSKEIVQSVLT
jgi:hypothetical protein